MGKAVSTVLSTNHAVYGTQISPSSCLLVDFSWFLVNAACCPLSWDSASLKMLVLRVWWLSLALGFASSSQWCPPGAGMCFHDAETLNLGLRSDNNTASAWDFSGALILPHSPLSASPPSRQPCCLHSPLTGWDPWGLASGQVLILNPHEGPRRCWVLCGSCPNLPGAPVGGNTYLQGPLVAAAGPVEKVGGGGGGRCYTNQRPAHRREGVAGLWAPPCVETSTCVWACELLHIWITLSNYWWKGIKAKSII